MTILNGIPPPDLDWTILSLHDDVEITISRRGAGAYSTTTGRYVAAAATETTTRAVVYPASGREMQQLDEARRFNETLVVIATDELRTAKADDHQADVLTDLPAPWDEDEWEVVKAEAWPGADFGWVCLAQRLGQ